MEGGGGTKIYLQIIFFVKKKRKLFDQFMIFGVQCFLSITGTYTIQNFLSCCFFLYWWNPGQGIKFSKGSQV